MPLPAQNGPSRINPLNLMQDYVVVNFVTTGPDPWRDAIVEIGALRVRAGRPVRQLETLINPERPLDYDEEAYVRIASATLESAPLLADILPYLHKFIGEDVIVTHSAATTITFLADLCADALGVDILNDYVDTLQLSRQLYPRQRRHRLSDMIAHLDIAGDVTGQAMDDAILMHKCYERMKADAAEKRAAPAVSEVDALASEAVRIAPQGQLQRPTQRPQPAPQAQALPQIPIPEPIQLSPPPRQQEPIPAPQEKPRRALSGKRIWLVPAAALCVAGIILWRVTAGGDPAPTPQESFAAKNGLTPTAPIIESVIATQAPTAEPEPTPLPTETPGHDPAASPPPAMLRSGEKGTSVKEMQAQLIELGYLQGDADGEYGPKTKAAVLAFQEKNHLYADGIAGEKTLAALYSDAAINAAAPTPRPSAKPTGGIVLGGGE